MRMRTHVRVCVSETAAKDQQTEKAESAFAFYFTYAYIKIAVIPPVRAAEPTAWARINPALVCQSIWRAVLYSVRCKRAFVVGARG
jgi:hypothetical protein